jgi:hypothetical protein
VAFKNGYLYDLEPTTDDRPFFFNFFKLSTLAEVFELRRQAPFFNEYAPWFPVGHMILLSSLSLITLLALVFIILPLGALPPGIGTSLRLRTLVYFACLGMGFMFIEICLMQRFVLFLGNPTYSMSVVLGGMLAFSGLGALWSSRFNPSRRCLLWVLFYILLFSLINAFALKYLLEPLFALSLGLRMVMTLLLLAPVSLALGRPFPLGVRILNDRGPELIPWAWGINGFLSVFSSLMATALAMTVGFTWVLLIAAIVYAVGLSLAPVADRGD